MDICICVSEEAFWRFVGAFSAEDLGRLQGIAVDIGNHRARGRAYAINERSDLDETSDVIEESFCILYCLHTSAPSTGIVSLLIVLLLRLVPPLRQL